MTLYKPGLTHSISPVEDARPQNGQSTSTPQLPYTASRLFHCYGVGMELNILGYSHSGSEC